VKKAIYIPTDETIFIVEDSGEYLDVILGEDEKTIPKKDVKFLSDEIKVVSLDDIKEIIFFNVIKKPLSDILYSSSIKEFTPELHQYKPLMKFLDSDNKILIADEVGLGKTIEAGMIYKEIKERENLKISLIVVPSSLTYKWKEEFLIRFKESFEIYKTTQFIRFIDEVEKFSQIKEIHKQIIISYHTLRDEKVKNKLENSEMLEIDFLIMDEVHIFRNKDTTTYKSVELITTKANNIVFLSATPVQNSVKDLFNILSLLNRDYFMDYEYFKKLLEVNPFIYKLISMIRNNYSIDEIKSYVLEYITDSKFYYLQNLLNEILRLNKLEVEDKVKIIDSLIQSDNLNFIINRTKKRDIGIAIPREAKSVIVDITKEEKLYYDSVIEFVKFLNPEVPQGFISIMPERMASSSMKASLNSFKEIRKTGKFFIQDEEELGEYYGEIDIKSKALKLIDKIIEKGEMIGDNDSKFLKFEKIIKELHSQNIKQMILFSFFKKTLDYLEIKLKKLGYKVGKIHGDFSVDERIKIIENFRDGAFDILLSSEVGSEGLDMQFCNVIINYDLPWNPMRVEQRIGRIDRIGQKFKKLYIFNLCIIDSIEARILNKLYNKLNIFENSIGELEPILGDLEKQLNIKDMINLSQVEIDKKLHEEELALHKKKVEISKNLDEFDNLLNNEFNYKIRQEKILNDDKRQFLQFQAQRVFLEFLDNKDIKYNEKNGDIKFSKKDKDMFFQSVKNLLKKENPLYKEIKSSLLDIKNEKDLKISFFKTEEKFYFPFSHSFIKLFLSNKKYKKDNYFICSYNDCNGYLVIYRFNFKHINSKSYIKVMIFNNSFGFIEEIDYFEFISKVQNKSITTKEIDFKSIKDKLFPYITKSFEKDKLKEINQQEQLRDIKIESIKTYFDKKIDSLIKVKEKVNQENIEVMKSKEIENYKKERDKKISLLKNKNIESSFEILAIGRIER